MRLLHLSTSWMPRELAARRIKAAPVREVTYMDRPHIAMPVVLLVGDIVVEPSNGRGRELVPATTIAQAPVGWNGRPVVPDHPASDDGANTPEHLESQQIGVLFETHFDEESRSLKSEAWLDVERVTEIDPDLIQRIMDGEVVELSVGAFILYSEESGMNARGDSYDYVWEALIPDHLALGLRGGEGACSVAAGCGGPRYNRAANEEEKESAMNKRLLAMGHRVLAAMGVTKLAEDEGTSDVELRDKLYQALRAVEPGFDGIAEVYPDSSTVIYVVCPEGEYLWFRRGYSLSDAGEVSLADDRAQVQMVTEYQEVEAAASTEVVVTEAGGCGCHKSGDVAAAANREGDAMKKQELIARLLASKPQIFTEADRPRLEAFTEAQLEAMTPTEEPPVVTPAATPVPPTPAATATEPTEDEALAALPASLRAVVARGLKQVKKLREGLVTALSAAQQEYKKEELEAMDLENLERLSRVVKLKGSDDDDDEEEEGDEGEADFSGRPLALGKADADDDVYLNPPSPYAKLRAKAN